jgi:hypothetical protein
MHGGPAFSDPSHADFWKASTAGELFLLRGFDEDGAAQLSPRHAHIAPGSVLDPVITIWRVGECLLHAERLATRLESEQVEVLIQWSGLDGRHIASLDRPRFWDSSPTASADTTDAYSLVEASTISGALPRIVLGLTEPLFVLFGFLELPESTIATELDRMRGRRAGS